jgi:O-antigen ligase
MTRPTGQTARRPKPRVRRPYWLVADSGPWAVAVQWVLTTHLVLAPLAFSGATLDAFEFPKVSLLQVTALVASSLMFTAWVCRGPAAVWHDLLRGIRDPVTAGALLFTLSAAVSTLWSISPTTSLRGADESFAGLETLAAYLFLFLATRFCCRTPAAAWRLLAGVAAGVAVTAAYALIQALRLDPFRWSAVSAFAGYARPFGTLGHANHLGAYLAMGLPLTGALAVRAARARHAKAAAVLGAITVLAAVGVAATLSRGAWAALGAVGVTLALAAGWRQLTRRRVALAVSGVALAAGVVVAVGTVRDDRVWEQVAARVRRLGDGAGRLELWRAVWAMAGDRPPTGVGLDCFHLGFARHRSLDYWRLEWNVTPPKAHNEALHILATQGIFGVVAGLILTVGLVMAARRAARRTDSADGRLLLAAIGAGVVGFYVQGLFSFTVAATGSLFVTLAAVLSRLGDGMQTDEAGVGTIGPGLLAGVALAAGLFAANAVAQGASAGPPWCVGVLILSGAAVAAVVALLRWDGAASRASVGTMIEAKPRAYRLSRL